MKEMQASFDLRLILQKEDDNLPSLTYKIQHPHHKADLLPGGQPLQKLTSQLETQDAGLAQAALQGLLIFLAGVGAPPRSLEYIVDDAHDILPQAAV